MSYIAWCTSHYRNDFAKEKAKELRQQGYTVRLGNYIKEEGQSYCKIYLKQDFNYHLLKILNNIKARIKYGKESIQEASENEKEYTKEICKQFSESCKLEHDEYESKLYVITDNGKLSISLN